MYSRDYHGVRLTLDGSYRHRAAQWPLLEVNASRSVLCSGAACRRPRSYTHTWELYRVNTCLQFTERLRV